MDGQTRGFIHFLVTCPRGTMFLKAVDATCEVKDAILLTGADDFFCDEGRRGVVHH